MLYRGSAAPRSIADRAPHVSSCAPAQRDFAASPWRSGSTFLPTQAVKPASSTNTCCRGTLRICSWWAAARSRKTLRTARPRDAESPARRRGFSRRDQGTPRSAESQPGVVATDRTEGSDRSKAGLACWPVGRPMRSRITMFGTRGLWFERGGEPSRYARRTPQNSGNAAFTISLISDRNAVGWNSWPSGMHGKVSSARI